MLLLARLFDVETSSIAYSHDICKVCRVLRRDLSIKWELRAKQLPHTAVGYSLASFFALSPHLIDRSRQCICILPRLLRCRAPPLAIPLPAYSPWAPVWLTDLGVNPCIPYNIDFCFCRWILSVKMKSGMEKPLLCLQNITEVMCSNVV